MNRRLLGYYNRELQYLRELGGEFAREFPKIAGRLGLDAFECSDPYVERLLEGFAFLAARIQLKIDAEFPSFTESLLQMVYPHYLAPTPSMAVVELRPNTRKGSLTGGFVVPRGSQLRSQTGKNEQTPCEYRTAHDVTLWPIELESVTHSAYLGDLGEQKTNPLRPLKGAIRLKFRTPEGISFRDLALSEISLFVRGQDQIGARLYELLMGASVALLVRESPRSWNELVTNEPVRAKGFEDEESLLPFGPRSFQGYRLLHEYFAFPSRFLSVELRGIQKAVQQCVGNELEVLVLLDRHDPVIESSVSAAHLSLFSTPVINLFSRKADSIHLSDRTHEYHVVPDRNRPLDLEVHSVTEVVGTGSNVRRDFLPFYTSRDRMVADERAAYFTYHRQPALASTRRRQLGPRSSYAGSEVFLSLVDANEGPYRSNLRELNVEILCTNRDLPLQMTVGSGRTDFLLYSGAPVDSVKCIAGPSAPRASHAWGEMSWRLVSHLSLNYLSLCNSPDGQGAAALRDLLKLYGDLAEPSIPRQIDGVRSIESTPIVRRLPTSGPASFGRGLEVSLQCDETAFEGASVFLLGAVLERFFAKYVSINSFTETVLRTTQRGEIMRWPARTGRRPLL